jgi:hypothetical protein
MWNTNLPLKIQGTKLKIYKKIEYGGTKHYDCGTKIQVRVEHKFTLKITGTIF